MKSNSAWRARSDQTLLPICNSNADYEPSDVHRALCGMLTSVFRLAGVIVVAALASGPMFAQDETAGIPDDWTHHHLVFSDPGTLHEASGRGSFDTWYKIVTDPRFTFQNHKRDEHPRSHEDKDRDRDKDNDKNKDKDHDGGNKGLQITPLERDWSATLGGAGVAPGMFPAKWQFSTTAAPSCSDYVVFPVNKAGVSGSGGQPNIVGYQNLYVNAGGTGFCAGLTAPTVLFSYFVGTGTVQTSPVLGISVGLVAYVESIAGNGTSVGSKFHVLKGAGTGGEHCDRHCRNLERLCERHAVFAVLRLFERRSVRGGRQRKAPQIHSGILWRARRNNYRRVALDRVHSGGQDSYRPGS
jgi:hypothetical protein